MSIAHDELELSMPRKAAWKNPAEAYGLSTLLHAVLIAILSVITLWEPADKIPEGLRAEYQSDSFNDLLEPDAIQPTRISEDAGGSESSSVAFVMMDTETKLTDPVYLDKGIPTATGDELTAANMSTFVGALSGNGGDGEGSGQGNGKGHGFFGDPGAAHSFVFVLDRSLSMNKPHLLSNGLTRFQRLKTELIRFIDKLTPEQYFFVIFFNDQITPMPAEGLVPATTANKEKYLKWIASANAVGGTDPSLSIRLAMKLEPEMIYFLSDGEMEPYVRRQLMKHDPGDWKLNTYVFGMRQAGPFMKVFAERHNGEYTYIP